MKKALSNAERDVLTGKVVEKGFFDEEEIAQFPDDELEMAVELIETRESVLDPDTGFMDSDEFTDVVAGRQLGQFEQRNDQEVGKYSLAELKNATVHVHEEATKQANTFLIDFETAAGCAGMNLAKDFLPHVVKKISAAMDKVDRMREVPSDMLRVIVVSHAKTPEGVRADTLKLLENIAPLGYLIYAPGGKPDIEDRYDGSVEGYKDIVVKFVRDSQAYSDPVVKEVLVVQPNMLRHKRGVDGGYGIVREANKRLLTETISDRRITITRTRDKFVRRAKELAAKAYSEDNPASPDEDPSNATSLAALQAFMIEARACADAMLENGSFIQRELPNVRLDDSLFATAIDLCSELIGTKVDVDTELFELDELIKTHSTKEIIAARVERILDWIRQDIDQMHELVMAVQSAREKDSEYGLAYTLIAESAVNILGPFNRAREEADIAFPDT